ncbi:MULTISPECIES: hypothetical protein [unclassified Arthrobacter]|uniref:hypothetical protein n=1 Tax=unclassified Arthrobacter TaxID=235627 RepID=UPI001E47B997|nr:MULTISPECIES: hypothetical protein [unclassified Arthrobacter]MCC9145205.1 hypothetical protein [Arthrobacter sp. zg-Y919]MDK1276433.1 hypothetical protein [Arthrobacter sp. zg.Y919]WIB01967.1 hypothetical protein QNO10_08190 [Arthrobacter sp. zg-Y919]
MSKHAAPECPEPTPVPHPERTVTVWEDGVELNFTFADCMKYHGPGFPGGVAHAFAALGRALPELAARTPDGRVERRAIRIRTPFGGPGGRDAFELVTRAVTGDRFAVLPELARPERGNTLARYVFEISAGDATVTCVLRDEGIVAGEFIELTAKPDKTAAELAHLEVLKREMRDRILERDPEMVYDLEG